MQPSIHFICSQFWAFQITKILSPLCDFESLNLGHCTEDRVVSGDTWTIFVVLSFSVAYLIEFRS